MIAVKVVRAQRMGSAAAAGWARHLTNYGTFWQIAPARSGRAAVRLEPVLAAVLPLGISPIFKLPCLRVEAYFSFSCWSVSMLRDDKRTINELIIWGYGILFGIEEYHGIGVFRNWSFRKIA